jgi:hypothetical protein
MIEGPLATIGSQLAEVRDSLGTVHMKIPASEIVARAKRRRTRLGLSAVGATFAVLGLALGLTFPSGHQVQPVHVHVTAWTVDTNNDGTVTLNVHELTHAALLAQVLGKAGVPAVVTTAQCLNQQNQTALAQAVGALRSGSTGVVIDPAAIPSGTAILISVLQNYFPTLSGRWRYGGVGFGWGLVRTGAPLTCYGSGHGQFYYTGGTR